MCFADGRGRAEVRRVVSEGAAHRAFDLFRDDEAHALDGIRHFADVGRDLNGIVLRQNAPPVEEFALQNAADERRVADHEEDMLCSEVDHGGIVGIVENFLDLLQRRRRRDEFDRPLERLLGNVAPERQTVAVHGHDRHGFVRDLKQTAGMDRTRHIFACREDRSGDHFPQLPLRHGDALFRFDVRQLRIVLRRHGGDRKRGNAAADGNAEALVHADRHLVVRQLPDDVEEQTCGHDALARLGNVGGNADGNARLQIISRQHHFHTGFHQQALE